MDETTLKRMLRAAMTHYIFKEPQTGVVEHTAASRLMATDETFRGYIGMVLEEMWPAATRV